MDEMSRRHNRIAPATLSAGRKNAAPAQRWWNAARRHLGRRALSPACAAFFLHSRRPAPKGFLRDAVVPWRRVRDQF
jgi:hypothetical protein